MSTVFGTNFSAWAADIYGTTRNDNIRGTPRDDLLVGLGGNDQLIGLQRNDIMFGDSDGPWNANSSGPDGNDQLQGREGDDELYGGMGDDLLIDGGPGNDKLYGDPGNDGMDGGSDDDMLYGGPGDDEMAGGYGADQFNCGYGYDNVIDFNEAEGDQIFTNRGDLGICEVYPCPPGFAKSTRDVNDRRVQTCVDVSQRTEDGGINPSAPIVPALPPQQGGGSADGSGGAGPSQIPGAEMPQEPNDLISDGGNDSSKK